MYKFTDDCLIGIDQIDEEHRKLFSMINEGIDLINKDDKTALCTAKNLIISLKEYAKNHFAHEEEYMKENNDGELERQQREHAQFTEYVNKHSIEQINEENAKSIMEDLLKYLSRWLYRHILGSDIMIGYNQKSAGEDPFAFTDKYKTGIEQIDEEHKKLFQIIRETNDLIYEELLHDKYDAIVHIIEELRNYTIMHFRDEEEYMERIGYEGIEAQKAAHTAFVDKLNQINLDNVDDNQQEYLCELINYLLSWLSTHILKMDKRIPVK